MIGGPANHDRLPKMSPCSELVNLATPDRQWMRLPRLRFTLRSMMIAVAIVAVACWGEMIRRRWVAYRQKAAYYAGQQGLDKLYAAAFYESIAETEQNREFAQEQTKSSIYNREVWAGLVRQETQMIIDGSETAEYFQQRAAYFGDLRKKYDRAATHPWLSVEPDPPPPVLLHRVRLKEPGTGDTAGPPHPSPGIGPTRRMKADPAKSGAPKPLPALPADADPFEDNTGEPGTKSGTISEGGRFSVQPTQPKHNREKRERGTYILLMQLRRTNENSSLLRCS
jgi:hypothetical protein